jgi:XTP/dITP diphosphohydrolase
MELVLATRNRHKVSEILDILRGLNFTVRTLDDFPAVPEVEEDGITCRENAIKKALIVTQKSGKIALADDTGLEGQTLAGRAGVYSSRFAGEHATFSDNRHKLLQEMNGVAGSKRKAWFRCVIALASPALVLAVEEGVLPGTIAVRERGREGFGYDPIFLLSGYGRTLAEMTPEEKNRISHRAKALAKIKSYLKRLAT